MKIYLIPFLLIMTGLIQACSNHVPDYTGTWEEINQENQNIKRILTITKQDSNYHVVDQLYNMQVNQITYDESSQGIIDGQQLLSGTNTLTNIIEIGKDQQSLIMYAYDNSIIKFKKAS